MFHVHIVHKGTTKQQRRNLSFPLHTNLVVPASHVQGCPPILVPELQVQPGAVQQLIIIMIVTIVMMMMMVTTWVQMIT